MFDLSTAAAIVDPLTAFSTMSTLDRIHARQQREIAAENACDPDDAEERCRRDLEEHSDETVTAT